ncbi:MAG TPA: hypothetical protein VIL20_03125 [Sandaracinaceae bacterium]
MFARVTDVVGFHARRGELRGAVRVVRQRPPERFRWRTAVQSVNQLAATLRGIERMRVEEPVRELVLDLEDASLRREVVLDARKVGVDLDRGEILPRYTVSQLAQLALEHRVELSHLARYAKLPSDAKAPIDTAACVVVGRALAEHHRKKAHRLWLSVPDPDGPEGLMQHHRFVLERAERERAEAERWSALAKTLLG